MASVAVSPSNLPSGSVDGQERRARAFVPVPRPRRRQVHRGVAVGEPAVVVAQQVRAFLRRQRFRERPPRLRKDVAHAVHEPVDLRRGGEKDAAQHEAQNAVRMCLRVRQRQRRAPRPAEDQPALEPELDAQVFDVGHQVLRRVVGKRGRRRRASRAALVVQHDVPERGIIEAAVMRQATAARPAMQEHQRNAVRVAARLPLHDVDGIERQAPGGIRLDLGKERRIG